MNTNINVNRIKGRVIEKGLSPLSMAEALGIDRSTYYRKLNSGGGSFTIKEAQKIVDILELSPQESSDIFFGT